MKRHARQQFTGRLPRHHAKQHLQGDGFRIIERRIGRANELAQLSDFLPRLDALTVLDRHWSDRELNVGEVHKIDADGNPVK